MLNVASVFNAFKHADVTTIMPFDFTGMIFTATIAYLAFNEVLQPEVFIGAAIIILSSLYLIRHELSRRRKDIIPESLIQE